MKASDVKAAGPPSLTRPGAAAGHPATGQRQGRRRRFSLPAPGGACALLRRPVSGQRSHQAAAAAISVLPPRVFRLRRRAGQEDEWGARDRSSPAACARRRNS